MKQSETLTIAKDLEFETQISRLLVLYVVTLSPGLLPQLTR